MRAAIQLIATAVTAASLSACAASDRTEYWRGQFQPAADRVAATTLSSGWRVDCTRDAFTDERRCFAGRFGRADWGGPESIPFQIYYVNGTGPMMLAGDHDFPGRAPSIRIDDGPAGTATASPDVIAALRQGREARVVYHVWPHGERRMVVSLDGFAQAHDQLMHIAQEAETNR
jgi:invasion protein IalB